MRGTHYLYAVSQLGLPSDEGAFLNWSALFLRHGLCTIEKPPEAYASGGFICEDYTNRNNTTKFYKEMTLAL